jgi:hypothetical protein
MPNEKTKIFQQLEETIICLNSNISSSNENQKILTLLDHVDNFIQIQNIETIVKCDFLHKKGLHITLTNLLKLSIESTATQDNVIDENVLKKSQNILNFLFFFSLNFKIEFFKSGGHKNILKLLGNANKIKFKDPYTLRLLLMNIWLLGIDTENYKNEWNELNAAEILFKIGQSQKLYEIDAYGAFAMIATDGEINSLADIESIIKVFIDLLSRSAASISQKKSCFRHDVQLNEDNEPPGKHYEVLAVEANDAWYFLTNILNVLYRLSVNDRIKFDLFSKYGVGDLIKTIIIQGTEIEKKYALKLQAQLCFDSQVLEIVSKDSEMRIYIEDLGKNCSIVKSLSHICEQILWTMNKIQISEAKKEMSEKAQIMISYNAASRDLCLKIKAELEKAGYKIWIDINEICGSSLDSMSNAVETSQFILMCVTEKYRQSLNCQAEAQYAFKLKKPVVPIIMQKGYENVGGWLGMIMSDKIYINFIKYTFEESIKRLLNQVSLMELKIYSKETKCETVVNTVKFESTEEEEGDCKNWNRNEVKKWFESIGCLSIYNKTVPKNGELLFELHEIQLNAPHFFYELVSLDKTNDDVKSMLVFSNGLKKLFKKKNS